MNNHEVVIRDRWSDDPTFAIHPKEGLNSEAAYACGVAERIALVAAMPDGEDSAGRARLRLATPQEVADRACEIAARMFEEFKKREWVIPIPSYAEMQKHVAAKAAPKIEKKRELADAK